MLVVLALYVAVLFVLSLFSLNRYLLVALFRAHRGREQGLWLSDADAPRVTVQLPIYNELYVVERLIRSACELDYPRDRLEIQVLDDSTDETLELTRSLVHSYRQRGVDIVHMHRESRKGFKAGALAYGLERAKGEFVAIFDADFVIPSDFLRRTLPHFAASPRVGMVQTRWTYLNEKYSTLTRASALGLDGLFVIEQPARYHGGLFLNFNGTAGVLRTSCIRDAGGWQHDTITEDLDLSYRAQIAGWKIVYLSNVTCGSEIPVDIHGLKAQQFRWTKGSQETARKILPRLWRSNVPLWQKTQGSLHLLSNTVYPLLLTVALLHPLVVYTAAEYNLRILWPLSAYFLLSLFGTFSYYYGAQRHTYADWRRRMLYFPIFFGASIGLSVHNARAAIEGLLGRKSPFVRTPKYHVIARGERWTDRRYRSPLSLSTVAELLVAVYLLSACAYAVWASEYGGLPFLALFAFGYVLVAGYSLGQGIACSKAQRRIALEQKRRDAVLVPVPSVSSADADGAARRARRSAARSVNLLLVLPLLHCGIADGGEEASAVRAPSTVVVRPDTGPAADSSTGYVALRLIQIDRQARELPKSRQTSRGRFWYRPASPLFEWRLEASGLLPQRAYRLELEVGGAPYSIASLRADGEGKLAGRGTLTVFQNQTCVGKFLSSAKPLLGQHELHISLKDDGAPREGLAGGSGVIGPGGESLRCSGNGDGVFEYRLYGERAASYRGSR